MCLLCIALLRGPPIGGQDRDGASYRRSAPYTLSRFAGLRPGGKHVTGFAGRLQLPYESSSFATSRGNEKIGGTGYCVTYDTDSQSRNADFISIARRAIRNPRGQRTRQTSQPSGRSPVNPHTEGVSKNLILSVRSRRRVFFRLFRLPRRRPGLPGGSRGGR